MTGPHDSSFDAGEPSGARARELRRRAEKKAAAMDAERLETLSPGQVEQLVHELRVHQIELELQNEELRRAQLELEASRTRYFSLYDLAPAGYVAIDGNGLITEANLAAASLLAAPRSALYGQPLSRFILAEDQDIYYRHRKALVETQKTQVCELRLDRPPAEPPVWIRLQTAMDRDTETDADIGRAVMVDISAQIKLKEILATEHKELAKQVDQQTADLLESNRQLRSEVDAHQQTQAQLLQKTELLKVRQTRLEEANAALKVLLRAYDAERSEWEEMVVSNIEAQTRPYLAKLAVTGLSKRQQTLLETAIGSLDEICSPLNRRFIIENIKLTPTETQVARLIRQGKPTKEIAGILGVAPSTIDYHRHNIRKKLNLSDQKLNLQSYLQSFK